MPVNVQQGISKDSFVFFFFFIIKIVLTCEHRYKFAAYKL